MTEEDKNPMPPELHVSYVGHALDVAFDGLLHVFHWLPEHPLSRGDHPAHGAEDMLAPPDPTLNPEHWWQIVEHGGSPRRVITPDFEQLKDHIDEVLAANDEVMEGIPEYKPINPGKVGGVAILSFSAWLPGEEPG